MAPWWHPEKVGNFEILLDFDACWSPQDPPARACWTPGRAGPPSPASPQAPWDRQFSPSARFRLPMEETNTGS
eukprot:gene11131-biopygen3335